MNKAFKSNLVVKPLSRLNSTKTASKEPKKFSFKDLPRESQIAIDRIIRVDHAG
jgi:hypothetical protein